MDQTYVAAGWDGPKCRRFLAAADTLEFGALTVVANSWGIGRQVYETTMSREQLAQFLSRHVQKVLAERGW